MTQKSEIKLEFVGASGNNPFIANVSSPRAVMDSNHMAQTLSLLTPNENIVKVGIEYELGKYINDKKTRYDSVVKAVIEKYPFQKKYNPTYAVFLEYEKDGYLHLDLEIINNHEATHGVFGYETRPTKELMEAGYNGAIPADTNLTRTRTLSDNGSYMYGRAANVVFMSHPSVAEDGIVISKSFAEKCSFLSVTSRTINIDKSKIPLNLYGDEDTYKCIPDIGQRVRPDGLLNAYREHNEWFSVSDMLDKNLREFDPVFDIATYVGTDSEIVDIEVLSCGSDRTGIPPKLVEQLDRYSDALIGYYDRVVKAYKQITSERRRMMTNFEDYKITPRLARFITDAMILVEADDKGRIKLNHKKTPINGYRIDIKTKEKMSLNMGYKLTSVNADKGVVCAILDDEDMPIDENGNRAEVIMDDTSTISRMNLGRVYESYLGATARDNRQRIVNLLGGKEPTDKQVKEIGEYLRGMYGLINPDMVRYLDGLTLKGLKGHISDIVHDNMYLYYRTDNEINIVDVIDGLKNSPYRPHKGKLTYRSNTGEMVTTEEDMLMGVMYIMVLDKVPITYSAVNTSRVNNFGFPVKSSNQVDRYRTPHPISPTKNLSETEVRILLAFASPEMLIEMMDYNLNLTTLKQIYSKMLNDDAPFRNDFEIDRRYNDYGQYKSLSILRHMFLGYGFDLTKRHRM